MDGQERWRLSVNDECIRSAVCLGMAPAYFEPGDDGKTRPTTEEVTGDPLVLDAAGSCPVEAITVRNAATGDRLDP